MLRRPNITRRNFCLLTGGSVASVALGACGRTGGAGLMGDGRLTARPGEGAKSSEPGRRALERNSILHVPKTATQSSLPLFVMLHGATQSAEDMFWYLGATPDETGVVVFAPNARDTTWDAIGGSFGDDVADLNRALEHVFETVAIDPARIAIGGFSDGATYGLSLGLINGDLFHSVVAFSPGFLIDGMAHGKPRVFISHGTHDHILPIDRCGRRLAANLISRGYEVSFREFDGDHEIPADVAREGLTWIKA
jgi:predicted esterase